MKVEIHLIAVGVLIGCFAGSPATRADTLTLSAGADTTLYESPFGDVANGSGEYLFAGTTARNSRRRALVRFDLGPIPAGAVISNVTLRLHLSRTISAAETVAVRHVLAAWGEGASDALLEEGGGAAAEPGDATWFHTFYADSLWAAPGGDFDATARASTSVVGNGYYDWSSPLLIADVQGWLAAPATNFGWLLHGDEDFEATAKRFDSFQSFDPAVRPTLIVEFAPEPSAALPLGLALLFRFRRAP